MINIISDKKGFPLAVTSDKLFAVTKKKSANEKPNRSFYIGDREFVDWGDNNRYPDDAVEAVGKTGVLNTAIGFKSRTSLGQGVVAMECDGYDENGEELMTPCKDKRVQQYLKSYQFLKYAEGAFRDLFKFGNAFPIFYFNIKGEIVNVICRNARHCRISRDKKYLLVYPNFQERTPTSEEECEMIEMLDDDDPFNDLASRKATGRLKPNKPIAFPRLSNYYSNNDYYALPDWDAAWKSGWLEVANLVPEFLKVSYANAMTMMWHIQIPYSWYKEKFPDEAYSGENGYEQRAQDIKKYWQNLEDNLAGNKNGAKTFFSDYGIDTDGHGDDKWIIDRLENEVDAKERLNTSAAANSEILFSMMINPSTLGAGMPGGSYAGNSGSGSDIRESYLVSVVTTYIEKRQVLFPVELMIRHNGWCDERLSIKYKETILTTLNTGNSKEEVIS